MPGYSQKRKEIGKGKRARMHLKIVARSIKSKNNQKP